jgi:hypothetical protein
MAWNGQIPQVRAPRRAEVSAGVRQRQLLPPHGVPAVESLPESSRARLPATYQAAQKAIFKCSRVYECKSWADKAAALASYARQARDHTLRMMAERIQARAVRRCGELLKQVPNGQGSRNQHGQLRDGAVTRHKAAVDAGLSERQRVTALRLAALPAPKFEALVESDSPPTVTQLAELGTQSRTPQPPKTVRATGERGARTREFFQRLREFCEQNKPAELAHEDAESLRGLVEGLRRWLDEFAENLPDGKEASTVAPKSSAQ